MSKALHRKEKEWAKRDKEELDGAVAALLQHRNGRRYLYHLLTIGKAIGQNAFTGHALGTAFTCGEQNVGQQIMAHILEVDSAGFMLMLKEQEDERRQRNDERAERRAEHDDGADWGRAGGDDD